MPSQWPYDPTARETATNIDWLRIHPQSLQANVRRWRRVSLQDLQRLVMEEKFKRLYDSLGMELKAEITRRLEHDEDADVPDEKPKTSKEDLLKRVDETITDAEFDGDIGAKLKGIELLAKLEQLLSTREKVDPNITINVITGVSRE